jgi:hypothetical protein
LPRVGARSDRGCAALAIPTSACMSAGVIDTVANDADPSGLPPRVPGYNRARRYDPIGRAGAIKRHSFIPVHSSDFGIAWLRLTVHRRRTATNARPHPLIARKKELRAVEARCRECRLRVKVSAGEHTYSDDPELLCKHQPWQRCPNLNLPELRQAARAQP